MALSKSLEVKELPLKVKKIIGVKGNDELILYFETLLKINRVEKQQKRLLVITDRAIYNIYNGLLAKCKRKILISNIVSLTLSELSSEFVVHVLNDYDYRFISSNKAFISDLIGKQYTVLTGKDLDVNYKLSQKLCDFVLSKKDLKSVSGKNILRQRKTLLENKKIKKRKSNSMAEEETENLLEPQRRISINDFKLLKVLGRGSFGKVVQVRKNDTGAVYALKIINKSKFNLPKEVNNIKAERKILEILTHPFLAKLKFAFQTKQKVYLGMDFYQGGELFFHMKQKKVFSEKEARFIVAEIIIAIDHLHKNSIIYRDLKPENVLLDDSGHICITDFGLSTIINTGKNCFAKTFCGTPEYMAPETVSKGKYSKEVDWWSLGVLLFEMIVGLLPFDGDGLNAVYQNILYEEPFYPITLSKKCKLLIMGFLKKNPLERLGHGDTGIKDIMSHPFFESINWESVQRKELEPVYKPNAIKSETDTTNFDMEFTTEAAVDSQDPISLQKDIIFTKFTYNDVE